MVLSAWTEEEGKELDGYGRRSEILDRIVVVKDQHAMKILIVNKNGTTVNTRQGMVAMHTSPMMSVRPGPTVVGDGMLNA